MNIHTRRGDSGETDLGGGRSRKDDDQIEVCGTIDELNSFLGLARAESPPDDLDRILDRVQRQLFPLAAEVAGFVRPDGPKLSDADVTAMEADIDRLSAILPAQKGFVLPGGTTDAAALHVARTVCRRAERRLVALASRADVRPTLLAYLNRLSDLLHVLARSANHLDGRPDVV